MTTGTPNETATEPVISVTESAAGQIKHLLAENAENTGKHLRVYGEQGGGSGMQYGMVFDGKRADDRLTEKEGVGVRVEAISAWHSLGPWVDFGGDVNRT